jgi:rare lipoprotein A (peptidoglycan hydrolase)
MVTVTRVDTDARVTCRVSDRGPADTSRVIDLSFDTFALLTEPGSGLIGVRLQW